MAKLSDLPRIVKNLLLQETLLEPGAKALAAKMRKRTRDGQGVAENLSPTHTLPQLKKSTIKRRQILKNEGKLKGRGVEVEKSNFTRTGASLRGLKHETTKAKVEITLNPEDGAKLIDALQIDKGYQFMRVSDKEYQSFLKRLIKGVRSALSKINITDL